MNLPESIADAVQPLFDALPLQEAMGTLAPKSGASPELRTVLDSVIRSDAIAARPILQSALWLYVDELDRSHTISQGIEDATGSYWHGIMHRREGDFSNAHYWFRKVGVHPAMAALPGYDGHGFVDEAGGAYPEDPESLVQRQRDEWANLFSWCANSSYDAVAG
jgi:hypothetical protein